MAFKITRPGALTKRARGRGRSINAEAAADTGKAGLAGKQARFYENVIKPANAKRKKRGSGSPYISAMRSVQ